MNKKFLIPTKNTLLYGSILALLLFFLPQAVFAHAGVQKVSEDTIVTFYQNPISPFVGEEVKITFVVTDLDFKPRVKAKGLLRLTDTYYGDESKDTKILDEPFVTDANGAVEFSHTFTKENFFNIYLQFDGKKEAYQHIDYLIQVRKSPTPIPHQGLLLFTSFLIGVSSALLGVKVLQHRHRDSRHTKRNSNKIVRKQQKESSVQ